MQYLEIHGNKNLIVVEKGTLNTDYYGLDTATCVWKCPMDSFGLIPEMLSRHPVWNWLCMEKRRVEIGQGFLIITGEYAGISGGRTPSVFECSYAGAEEPIQTHVDFVSQIAGKPSSPKNGAVFLDIETRKKTTDDARGVFEEFSSQIGGARNRFAGVTAYLLPEATMREVWQSESPVSGSGLGRLGSPPFSISISGDWLFTGVSFVQRGRIYTNTREWRASGREGWIPEIYG